MAPIVKEYIEKGNAPGGLIELAEDTNLVAALQITDDEFRTLASIALPASVDRDGYVQLLMTARAITKACRWTSSFPFLKRGVYPSYALSDSVFRPPAAPVRRTVFAAVFS
jgi:hypothetical protein